MDYQFERNEINEPLATFSAGHEAIGHFLSSELKTDLAKCEYLLDIIAKIEKKQLFNQQYNGRDYQLNLSDSGIEIKGTALAFEAREELPEGTELYDQEQEAECGLFDFKMLLLDWVTYLTDLNE
jgi:uncharacterized protein YacL (UPF0231 family)